MKKHNEGYTLPLVMVVMVVLCLVAVSIMSVSLHNLQRQKAYIERMEDQYAAQGEVEKMIAGLNIKFGIEGSTVNGITGAETIVTQTVTDTVVVPEGTPAKIVITKVEYKPVAANSNTYSCYISFETTAAAGSVKIEGILVLDKVFTQVNNTDSVKINVTEVRYEQYNIGAHPEPAETEVTG